MTVETDHLNLKFLNSSHLQRCQRWNLTLAEYSPEIKYIPGKSNVCADMLSRTFLTEEAQNSKGQNSNTPTLQIDTANKLKKFIHHLHNNLNHPGITKTLKTIKPLTNQKNLENTIKQEISTCTQCQINKISGKKAGLLKGKLDADFPLQRVNIDICGPFNTADRNSEEGEETFYILTIIDSFSRWTELILLKDIRANTIKCKFEREWLRRYPNPSVLHSDQGTQFLSSDFQTLLKKRNIQFSPTLTYNPCGNALVERIHRELNSGLRIYENDPVEEALSKIAEGFRKTFHRTLGTSPANIILLQNSFNPEERLDY